MSKKILVTGAGGPAAISFIRALNPEGIAVYAADMDALAPGLYLVPSSQRILVPRGDADDFVDRVLVTCRHFGIDVLVPTVDAELLPLARRRAEFEAMGTQLLLAPLSALRSALDKFALAHIVSDIVTVPKTRIASGFTPSERDGRLIVKPRSGSGSRGFRVLAHFSDLTDEERNERHILQELLPGDEYSVDVFSDLSGRALVAVPRRRLKVDSGVATVSETVYDETLQADAMAVANRLGLTFASNIQFKRRADGTPALLEVNPRFPGTMPLTIEAGVNMPQLALDMVLGREVPASITFREVAMVRTFREHFVESDVLGAVTSVDAKQRDAA